MSGETDHLQNFKRELLVKKTEYEDLANRIEAMISSLQASAILLRDSVQKSGEQIRSLILQIGDILKD